MKDFFGKFSKGIVCGIGGVAPGLSGSVLMVMFGIYQKTLEAISSIFNFKKLKQNLSFLIPLFLGIGVGVLLFSKLVDFLLENFEMYTRFAFLGLIVGTVPLMFKEVTKNGIKKWHYIIILVAFALGILLFVANGNLFPTVTDPNIVQSTTLGVAVAGSTIIPGVDSAAILSALGLYELYVSSIANLNFSVLLPAGVGLGLGVLLFSMVINKLIKSHYTVTFSIIFGLFISIIPSVLNGSCYLGLNVQSFVSIAIAIVCFLITFFLEKIKNFVLSFKDSHKASI